MAKKSYAGPNYTKLIHEILPAYQKAQAAERKASGGSFQQPPVGGSRGTPGWMSLSKQADLTLTNARKEAEKILGKQGASKLDEGTLKAIQQAKTSDEKAALLGKPREKKKSWWEKGLDIISRPIYGVSQGAKQGIQKVADVDNTSNDFLDAITGFGHGFGEGFTGKKKSTFSDVIQNVADTRKAYGEGRKQDQVKEGEAKVNKALKYGLGFGLDVALDPTTYAGVGLVAKAGKGAETDKTLTEAGRASKALRDAGLATHDEVFGAISHRAPVEGLSKKKIATLEPDARRIAEEGIVHQASLNRKELRNFRKSGGAGTAVLGRTIAPGSNKSIKDVLAGLEKTGVEGTKGLTETALKLVDPNIKKQLALRLGKAQVPLPGVAAGVGKVSSFAMKADPIARTVEGFNKAFRAKAGINPTLNAIRNETSGQLGNRLVEYTKSVHKLYNTPKAIRTGVVSSWRNGSTLGNAVYGIHPVTGQSENLLKNFDDEITRISSLADTNGLRPSELSGYLPKAYREWVIPKRGQQGWLLSHVKKSDKINDPMEILHMYNSAVEQALARRSLHEQIGKEFGISRSVKKNGKHTVSETRSLVNKGWREPKVPGLEGQIFHPEVARGIERMDEVFKNRITTNAFLRSAEKTTTILKSLFTLYNPGFHPRTAMGEALLTYLGGVPIAQLPRFYEKSTRILKDSEKGLKGNSPIVKTKFGNLTIDQVRHAYLNSGIRTGYIASDLAQASVDKARLGRKVSSLNAGVHHVAGKIEDAGRLSHFMYDLSKSNARSLQEAIRESAADVLKYHLDYSAVTKTERGLAAAGIPFYKWIRLSTPLMVDILMHDPGKVLAVPKGLSALSKAAGYDTGEGQGFNPASPDAMIPYYLREHGAYPMFGKNTHYYDPTSLFPVAGSTELLNGNITDVFNPLIGKSITAAGKLEPDSQLGRSVHNKQSWSQFLSGITPQSTAAYNQISPPDPDINRLERLLMLLGNPGFVSNTPKKQKGEAFRERYKSYENLKSAKKETGK